MIKFVKQEVVPLGPCPSDEAGMLKRIELCGRVAYRSEDKITEDSALGFVQRMKKSGHLSVLEHSNIAILLRYPMDGAWYFWSLLKERGAFHVIKPVEYLRNGKVGYHLAIAGNVRLWLETIDFLDGFQYQSFFKHHLNRFFPSLFDSPTDLEYQLHWDLMKSPVDLIKRVDGIDSELQVFTFKIVCDRGISHELVRHRVLCLSGNTALPSFRGKRWTIKQLFDWQSDPKRKGRIKLIKLRSVDENGKIVRGEIRHIIRTGVNEVFNLKLKNGKRIKATSNHRFLTSNGWMRLGDISVGDLIATNGLPALANKEWLEGKYISENNTLNEMAGIIGCSVATIQKALRQHGISKPLSMRKNITPGRGKPGMFTDEHRLEISKRMSGKNNHAWLGDSAKPNSGRMRANRAFRTVKCDECGSENNIQIHHTDRNPLNNDPDNIHFLCSACHKAHHAALFAKTIVFDAVESILSYGYEETFDIEMTSEPHNFVANGIVVHNSFTQESTRYVNYAGKGVTFILPEDFEPFWHEPSGMMEKGYSMKIDNQVGAYERAATQYEVEIALGKKPQIARDLLPNLLKTELYISGRWSGWKHFIELRDSSAAHPRIQQIAKEIRAYFAGIGLDM